MFFKLVLIDLIVFINFTNYFSNHLKTILKVFSGTFESKKFHIRKNIQNSL